MFDEDPGERVVAHHYDVPNAEPLGKLLAYTKIHKFANVIKTKIRKRKETDRNSN